MKNMKKTVSLLLLSLLLVSCAAKGEGNPELPRNTAQTTAEMTEKTEMTTESVITEPAPTVPLPDPVILDKLPEGNIIFGIGKDADTAYCAALPLEDGSMRFFVRGNLNGSWEQVPARAYRGDLFWSESVENGKYIDFGGNAVDGEEYVFDFPHYNGAAVCILDDNVRFVWRIKVISNYSREKELEMAEKILTESGMEVLKDHRYAPGTPGLDEKEYTLLAAGTILQMENLGSAMSNGFLLHPIPASYAHYAPGGTPDLIPALTDPRFVD